MLSLSLSLTSRQRSLLGASLCILANTLISLALNVQKLAHVRMQEGGGSSDSSQEQEEESQEEEERGERERNGHLPGNHEHEHENENENENGRNRIDRRGSGDGSCPEEEESEEEQQEEEEEEGTQPNTRFLRSKLWWSGIGLMLLGETGNFISYGFAPASLVAPLGSVALLANVFLAPLLLKERFASSDLFGVLLATLGAAGVVAASSSTDGGGQAGSGGPDALWNAVKERDFLIFTAVMVVLGSTLTGLSITRWGERYVLVDVGACAVFGGFTVLSTKGISSLLSYGASKGNVLSALKSPVSYACIVVLLGTALIQITFLNRALQRFDARKVIPSQFVLFTISSISGSAVLFRDFERADAAHLVGFLVACLTTFAGVFVLTRRKGGESGGKVGDEEEGEGEAEGNRQGQESRKGSVWKERGRRGGEMGTDEERQALLDPTTTSPLRRTGYGEAGRLSPLAPRRPMGPFEAITTGSVVPTYPDQKAHSQTQWQSQSQLPASAGLPILQHHRHVSSSSSSSSAAAVAVAPTRSYSMSPGRRPPGQTSRFSTTPTLHSRTSSGHVLGGGGGGGSHRTMTTTPTPKLSLARGASATGAGGYLLLLSGSGPVSTSTSTSTSGLGSGPSPSHPTTTSEGTTTIPVSVSTSVSTSISAGQSDNILIKPPSTSISTSTSTSTSAKQPLPAQPPRTRTTAVAVGLSISPGRALLLTDSTASSPSWGGRTSLSAAAGSGKDISTSTPIRTVGTTMGSGNVLGRTQRRGSSSSTVIGSPTTTTTTTTTTAVGGLKHKLSRGSLLSRVELNVGDEDLGVAAGARLHDDDDNEEEIVQERAGTKVKVKEGGGATMTTTTSTTTSTPPTLFNTQRRRTVEVLPPSLQGEGQGVGDGQGDGEVGDGGGDGGGNGDGSGRKVSSSLMKN